mmetsp:Transcript_80025/g.226458  ORF Transcript_80025/g.226458 Transcript_80025/m.226458 type:complete len:222 (+) Transcript_80025:803-1468(+)
MLGPRLWLLTDLRLCAMGWSVQAHPRATSSCTIALVLPLARIASSAAHLGTCPTLQTCTAWPVAPSAALRRPAHRLAAPRDPSPSLWTPARGRCWAPRASRAARPASGRPAARRPGAAAGGAGWSSWAPRRCAGRASASTACPRGPTSTTAPACPRGAPASRSARRPSWEARPASTARPPACWRAASRHAWRSRARPRLWAKRRTGCVQALACPWPWCWRS